MYVHILSCHRCNLKLLQHQLNGLERCKDYDSAMASPSSYPVCRAAPSLFTSLSAPLCQPQRDSATIGKNAIPWARQSSSCCRRHSLGQTQGWWQPQSSPQSHPSPCPCRWTSEGPICLRKRNLPSLVGPRPAATAVSKRASLKELWRLILSPPDSQQSA